MTSFEAKIYNVPCEIELDEDYKIKRITSNKGQWTLKLSDNMLRTVEDQYSHLIEEIKREDRQEFKENDAHIKLMKAQERYI